MVSRSTVLKLENRIGALVDAANPPLTVVVFRGESLGQARAKHLARRPDHLGRKIRYEHRDYERSLAHELCATHSLAELSAAIDGATTDGGKIGD